MFFLYFQMVALGLIIYILLSNSPTYTGEVNEGQINLKKNKPPIAILMLTSLPNFLLIFFSKIVEICLISLNVLIRKNYIGI
jgi:hypothetical protein